MRNGGKAVGRSAQLPKGKGHCGWNGCQGTKDARHRHVQQIRQALIGADGHRVMRARFPDVRMLERALGRIESFAGKGHPQLVIPLIPHNRLTVGYLPLSEDLLDTVEP